ncbi:MAG: sigma-70 family RNA polymerase sigma factor [Patescibacteria group bacterium]|nr:sigma-70 family RNA polymerase sigma factor [Patescibacteria group bacterium]MDE2015069.1 sigma-70 family RNA polymerase sigma factor [Patescibacteria group bacterium]MDE2226497.1 sigma-70 family RNA polymerase sigma factor [Patescibacteria group bacterium]
MLDGEEKLIKRAIRGGASAYGTLYDYYQPKIYRFVLIKVGRREDAEDLTHQVFLSAWQNVGSYKSMGFPFGSWLYQIARNSIADYYRSRKQETSLENVDPEYFVAPAIAHFGTDEKMEMERVMLAVQKLKPEYQDIVIMRFVEDMSVKEAAAAMDKSEGAVKLLQHRAINELKKILL